MIHSSIIIVYTSGIMTIIVMVTGHGNWSWYANRPAMQIIKNHSTTCYYG
jgi:hypothetical protein